MKFKVGQLWEFESDNKGLKLQILKIDSTEHEDIVHIAIIDNKDFYIVEHMPFSEQAIQKSITHFCGMLYDFPEYEDGYNYWKSEFEQGRAGLYTITVYDAFNLGE